MKRLILIGAMLAPLMLADWGKAQDKPVQIDAKKLIGKWKVTNNKVTVGNAITEFKPGGKMSVTGDFDGKRIENPGAYKVEGNKLLMTIMFKNREMDEVVTILKLTDDVLATRDKNGTELIMERVKAKKVEPVQIDAKKLIGQWKPSAKNKGKVLLNMVVEFKAGEKMNFTFNIDDKVTEVAGTYKVEGTKLTMKFKAGEREMDEVSTILKLTDDELATRDKNGKEEYFERVKMKKNDK